MTVDQEDMKDLIESENIDIKDCTTVCLALGPYRNLTTITAASLFLHPDCQVLNHAGNRIFGNKEIDFLSDYSKEKLDRYIRFAIQISQGGQRGGYGGSIVHSHAFDSQYEMKEIFEKTGFDLVKNNIKCLFWKESLATSYLIRENQVDLGKIFSREKRLKFLMPVRNPMDCATSNLKTNLHKRIKGIGENPSFDEVLNVVLNELFWFETLRQTYPDRFFYFFEHSFSRETLMELADFLDLSEDENWVANASAAMVFQSHYQYDRAILDHYEDLVKRKFSPYPELIRQLLIFSGPNP
jgi:hypothetical protein